MIHFTANGIQIDDKEKAFYSGSFHYWRSCRKDWEKILAKIKEMGFNIVETYVPWSIHEPEKDCFDFGEIKKENNVEDFLSLCEKMNLYVIVRPGPHINAELDNFGFPRWVIQDTEMTAKNPWGTEVVYPYITRPYAIPSYASKKFYEYVYIYYQKLGPILQRHAYPKGNIIAIQADNETCNFFRDNPYIMDYSNDSIKQYRTFLSDKYNSITKLNTKVHTKYKSFEDIMPPTGLNEDNYYECREWVLFKEWQIVFAIQKITDFILELKLNIPIFHNCAYQTFTPISIQKDEKILGLSVAGMDAYPEPEDSQMLKERIRFLSGSSVLNYVPEFGSGSYFDRGLVLTPKQEEFGYMYSFMNGMKAVNYYMLVERDRWTGCPLKNNGIVRNDFFDLYTSINKFLEKYKIWKDKRTPKVMILKNYEVGRMKALSYKCGLSLLSSNCLVSGPDIPNVILRHELPEDFKTDCCSDIRFEDWTQMITAYLDAQNIDYDYSDMFISRSKLKEYDFVFASTYPYMDEQYQRLLAEYCVYKGKTLLIGPHVPDKNEYGETYSLLDNSICIHNKKELSQIGLCTEQQSIVKCEENGIEISLHECDVKGKKHMYLANVSKEYKSFTLTFVGKQEVKGIWRDNHRILSTHSILVEIEPFTVSIYELKEVVA